MKKVAFVCWMAVVLFTASPGFAELTPGIEIDGNYIDNGAGDPFEDWWPDHPPFSDPFQKEDDTLCGTSPSPKNDITHYFLANNDQFLYIGMERLANTGQTSFFFSFDIEGDGPSFGDFIFVFCYGSRDRVTDTYVLEYDPVIQEFVRDDTPPIITFEVNKTRIPAPFGALDRHGRPTPFIESGKFAEAGIDLDSIEGFDICAAVAVEGEVQTKSSCSLSSQCKDTTGPFIYSFQQLEMNLVLAQDDPCLPVITATANASGPRTPFTYLWFLDGAPLADPMFNQDQIIIPIPPDDCGPHDIFVIVDDGLCTMEDGGTVDINVPPAAGFAGIAVGPCDLTLTFDGSTATDCDGDPLTYAWDFNGDGVVDSTDAAGTFTYSSCGEYTVSLTVNDGVCDSPVIQGQVYANEPPVAGIEITPEECLTVGFLDTSVDCDLNQTSPLYTETLTRTIDFGDGSPTLSDPSGKYTYPWCGDYTVTITETDAMGCTSTAQREVSFTMSVTVK